MFTVCLSSLTGIWIHGKRVNFETMETMLKAEDRVNELDRLIAQTGWRARSEDPDAYERAIHHLSRLMMQRREYAIRLRSGNLTEGEYDLTRNALAYMNGQIKQLLALP